MKDALSRKIRRLSKSVPNASEEVEEEDTGLPSFPMTTLNEIKECNELLESSKSAQNAYVINFYVSWDSFTYRINY